MAGSLHPLLDNDEESVHCVAGGLQQSVHSHRRLRHTTVLYTEIHICIAARTEPTVQDDGDPPVVLVVSSRQQRSVSVWTECLDRWLQNYRSSKYECAVRERHRSMITN